MMVAPNRKRHVTGAILCGGMSSRMGASHAPKHAIALHDGRAMIEHIMAALAPVCDAIVAIDSSTTKAQGLPSMGPGLRFIRDLRPRAGPLGGIEALLASAIDCQYIVCPCDVPRVTTEVFESLLAETDALSTIVRVEGREELSPLPARISARALPIVRQLLDEGRRAVHQLHERLAAHVVEVPTEWERLLVNVNTPEDLAQL